MMSNSPLETLPEELIFDILLRLPVKSLIRCKSVCKSWRSMITRPLFVSEHLKRSSKDGGSSVFRITRGNPDGGGRGPTNWILHFSTLEVQCQVEISPDYLRVVGSCNGIVCFSDISSVNTRKGFLLWNPATRQTRIIPSSTNFSGYYGLSRVCFGFGYSPEIDDYKLVTVFPPYGLVRTEVLTLKEGSWRDVQPPDNYSAGNHFFRGTFVNGTLNWSCHEDVDEPILSFDLGKDAFKSICNPPDPNQDGPYFCRKLAAIEPSLLCLQWFRDIYVDIWMTDPQANQSIWTRLLRVNLPPEIGLHHPLGVGIRGEFYIYFTDWDPVTVYELSTGAVLDVHPTLRMFDFNLYQYVESLVPLLGQ